VFTDFMQLSFSERCKHTFISGKFGIRFAGNFSNAKNKIQQLSVNLLTLIYFV